MVEPCVDLGSPLQEKMAVLGVEKASGLGILWLVTLGPQMLTRERNGFSFQLCPLQVEAV